MDSLLDVSDLQVRFRSDFGDRIVTDHISFHVAPGEILGIAGESGSGKSVTSLSVMGLLPKNGSVISGKAMFDGKDLFAMSDKELDQIRGKDICMIYQDALASLDPVFTIGSQMSEAIRHHVEPDKKKAKQIALEWLDKVGIPDPADAYRSYPYEFSGGMRQRVMIAMGLSCHPRLLIADEPTTALDVTIQAQIMKIIRDLRSKLGMSVILISHDLGLIAQNADRVMVMYAGQFVEIADVRELYHHPQHPYTRALLASVPDIHDQQERQLYSIPGSVPQDYTSMTGCRFASRCAFATEACKAKQSLFEKTPGHWAACIRSQRGELDE